MIRPSSTSYNKLVLHVSALALSLGLAACSSEKSVSGGTKQGTANSQAGSQDENVNPKNDEKTIADTSKDKKVEETKAPSPAPKLTDSQIIGKMSWEPVFDNVDSGKLFTGFGGGANFVFTMALVLVADGFIPKEIFDTLSKEDLNRIYSSPEFKKKSFDLRSKLTLTSDPSFFQSEELPADQVDPEDPMSPLRVFFLTTLKAGSTTVDLTLDGKKLTVPVTVAAYTAQQLADGRARYTTAVAGATPSPSCVSCHGAQGGANHSPTYLARFADASIMATIETGKNPEDGYTTSIAHKMTFATPAQRAGIVAYLRSLPPMP